MAFNERTLATVTITVEQLHEADSSVLEKVFEVLENANLRENVRDAIYDAVGSDEDAKFYVTEDVEQHFSALSDEEKKAKYARLQARFEALKKDLEAQGIDWSKVVK